MSEKHVENARIFIFFVLKKKLWPTEKHMSYS